MSCVLVTGAGGFIGRHALAPLAATGMEVHAITSSRPPAGAPAGVRWHRADLLAPHAAADLAREVRPSHLLHFAWCTQPGLYWTASENLDWVQASLRLLRAFGKAGGRRAVFAGTCAEYAWGRRTHCVEERPAVSGTPTAPATLYGAAKHGLHVVADAWARQTGMALAWGRIFSVYGPHEHPDRLVGGLARALLRGEPAACSHGRQLRDYLYAPELGAAFAALLASEVTGALNMASGEPVRVEEVVAAVAAAAGRPDLVRRGARPGGQGEPDSLTADVRRLRDEVGWAPTVGLHEGVSRTVDWWRQTRTRAAA
ncbi:MAG: NAD-dependent epimerase/dehydratase family protein [Solirubrobacterales bacterium]